MNMDDQNLFRNTALTEDLLMNNFSSLKYLVIEGEIKHPNLVCAILKSAKDQLTSLVIDAKCGQTKEILAHIQILTRITHLQLIGFSQNGRVLAIPTLQHIFIEGLENQKF